MPPVDSNEPIQEETIVYKSPFYIKHKHRSKCSRVSPNHVNHDQGVDRKIYEIYGDHPDAHKAILESSIFDSVELITYACTKSHPSPIRHCSLRNVPREALLKTMSQPTSLSPLTKESDDMRTTSSIIFVSKARTSISPPLTVGQHSQPTTTSSIQNADVERALIDFYQCSQINEVDDTSSNHLDQSDSDDLEYSLSNYNEMCEETSSLLRLNEHSSSAFIDDECNADGYLSRVKEQRTYTPVHTSNSNHHLMKMMILNKTRRNVTLDTTSDDRTTTNSFSLNTYSQDFSVDKIFQYDSSTSSYKPARHHQPLSTIVQPTTPDPWCSSSSTTSSSCADKPLPNLHNCANSSQQFLTAVDKKRNPSSDSDAITTTTTTLTTSTQYEGSVKPSSSLSG